MMKMRIVLFTAAFLLGPAGIALGGTSAARLGDPTNHSGIIVAGSSNVFILGAPAALFGAFVPCPIPFHVGGNIAIGSPKVRINGLPAVRTGSLIPETGAVSTVIGSAATVLIQ
jgi:uncharacterized Zn-binding protein involved in type VI secretion